MFHIIVTQINESRAWLHRTSYSHTTGAITNVKAEAGIPPDCILDYSYPFNASLVMNLYTMNFILIYVEFIHSLW